MAIEVAGGSYKSSSFLERKETEVLVGKTSHLELSKLPVVQN